MTILQKRENPYKLISIKEITPPIKDFKFNLIKKDTQTLISAYRWPLVIVSVLMGFLIFIMNVFFAGAIYGHQFNSTMKDKL